MGRNLQRLQIDVRFQIPIEQYQPIRAGGHEPLGKVWQAAEILSQFDRQGDGDGFTYRSNQVDVLLHDAGRGDIRIGGDKIDIQFQRIGSRLFDRFGIACPATGRSTVEAANDRDRNGLFGRFQSVQVALGSRVVIFQIGEIGQRFGKSVGLKFVQVVHLLLMVRDLFLEQRGQDRGGDAGLFQAFQRVQVSGQRTRRSDDGFFKSSER